MRMCMGRRRMRTSPEDSGQKAELSGKTEPEKGEFQSMKRSTFSRHQVVRIPNEGGGKRTTREVSGETFLMQGRQM